MINSIAIATYSQQKLGILLNREKPSEMRGRSRLEGDFLRQT
jgi:hypothetical protein